jgi:hypothetical protein
MTEKEAKEKWCPMARCKIDHDCADTIAVNRWSDGAMIRGSLCVASDCMMWRWEIMECLTCRGKGIIRHGEVSSQSCFQCGNGKWNIDNDFIVGTGTIKFGGYCGLGGKP